VDIGGGMLGKELLVFVNSLMA